MEHQRSNFVPDWLEKRAQLTPSRVALEDTINGQELTYDAWNQQVNQTANLLTSLGVKHGDRVAVYAANSVSYMDVWHACGKIGAILQNLNWRLTVSELEGLLIDAAPIVLCYSKDFAEQADQLHSRVESIEHVIAFDQPASPTHLSLSRRSEHPKTLASCHDLSIDDPWVICYTGGTTGLPKGAILTHGNMTWNSINTVMSWGLDQDDVAILNAPLFHTGGLNVFTLPLIHIGGKSIVCKSFDTNQVFDLVARGEVTLFFGVPTMFLALQHDERWHDADFSNLKVVISGGAPCPMPVFEAFWEKQVDFKTGYGLTEAGPNTFWLPASDVRRKPGAVGIPLFHVDVKLVRPDGSCCAANEAGELVIRGPHVTPGYWNNPDATAAAIVDGWLHTGDLAVIDDEGYYTIVGRLKDMIISGGENIYPAEVESVMHAHPAVVEAALIGVPDEKWGEVGRAIIVLAPNSEVSAADLLSFIQDRLARYKIPKSIRFVDALPKTGAGKIDKKVLSERFGGL